MTMDGSVQAQPRRYDAVQVIDSRDVIGEGPAWDAVGQRLLWTDNKNGVVHQARESADGDWVEADPILLDKWIGAVVPRAGGGLLVARETELLTVDADGSVATFATFDLDHTNFHLNDAKCDPQGRLWVGTIDRQVKSNGGQITPGRGSLFRVDSDGRINRVLDGVTVSNGLDWSPDGQIFYYIDSHSRTIDAFDFDGPSGTIANRRTVVELGAGEGLPDGLTCDDEGCLWLAVAGGHEIRRYAPDGDFIGVVRLPVPTVTSCAFGGAARDILFITTARVKLPKAALSRLEFGINAELGGEDDAERGAGALFMCRPGVTGAAATAFAG